MADVLGASTRLLGATTMVHGDDHGLRLPPRVAPVQVVVLVARPGEGVLEQAARLVDDLTHAGIRAELIRTPTSRSVDASSTGSARRAPRVELGPRDIAAGQVPIALRARAEKTTHALDVWRKRCRRSPSRAGRAAAPGQSPSCRLTSHATTIPEAMEQARVRAARIPWATLRPDGERRLLEDGISVRCLLREDGEPLDDPDADGVEAIVARAH